jgi:hypothetical protein
MIYPRRRRERLTYQAIYLLAVVGRYFREVHAETFGEFMMAYDAGRAHLVAIRQAEIKRHLRPRDRRDVAFDEGPARVQIEQAAIARVAIRLAPRTQKTPILHPVA